MTTKNIRVEITRIMEISSTKVPQLANIDDAEQVWNDDDLKEQLIKLTEESGNFEVSFTEFWSEEEEEGEVLEESE